MIIKLNEFNGQIEDIKRNIKDYEMHIYETISTAKNMSYYWKDGYTSVFFKKVDDMLQTTNDLVNSLYRSLSSLQSISSFYHSINAKRSYLLGHGGSTINSSYYIVQSDDDEDVASKKRSIYNSIQSAEDHISSMLSNMRVPFVSRIDFNSLEKQSAIGNEFVGMLDNVPNEIKILEQKCVDARNSSNNLKNSFGGILSYYTSGNTDKISNNINQINDSLHSLDLNLNNACEYITVRREKYKKAIAKIVEEIKKTNIE